MDFKLNEPNEHPFDVIVKGVEENNDVVEITREGTPVAVLINPKLLEAFRLIAGVTKDYLAEPEEPTDESLSPHARMFDETNHHWHSGDPGHNRIFLQAQEKYFNHKLRAYGHVFLNEVYDALGFPRTGAGATNGWLNNSESGDDYIDIGLHHPRNTEFNNNLSPNCWLDFNVDGIIYDKI